LEGVRDRGRDGDRLGMELVLVELAAKPRPGLGCRSGTRGEFEPRFEAATRGEETRGRGAAVLMSFQSVRTTKICA
jgi:hypothetical protein